MKKPVMLLSKQGEVSSFIRESNLGFVWDGSMQKGRAESLKLWIADGCPVGPGNGHLAHDLEKLVDSLEDELAVL